MTGTPISERDVQIAVAIALKLAKFRRTRGPTDSDEVCAAAARAVVEGFQRSGWAVVSVRPYPGWGDASHHPNFGSRRGCEDCD